MVRAAVRVPVRRVLGILAVLVALVLVSFRLGKIGRPARHLRGPRVRVLEGGGNVVVWGLAFYNPAPPVSGESEE